MDCKNPSYDEMIFCIKLFKIMSVSNFEHLMNDLGFSKSCDQNMREIARDFLRQILPVDGQIILPKPYIGEGISENDMLEAWSMTFTRLAKIDLDSDVCAWFNKVKAHKKHYDNRIDTVSEAWNKLFYDWCLTPDMYPELPFQETIIQRLRIEMLIYRTQLAELSPRVNQAVIGKYPDEWDEILSRDKNIDTSIRGIARLEYAVTKWISVFTIFSYEDLHILENIWGETVRERHGIIGYFSLIELWEHFKSSGYI